MKPLYIFDLDGTLALTEHRQHIIDNKENPHRWRDFFAACDKDLPNFPVIATVMALEYAGCEIRIWSGRSDEVYDKTVEWLRAALDWDLTDVKKVLVMRKAGDSQPDDTLKLSWLKQLREVERREPIAIFDDRQKVVDMWRKNGVACFQVRPSFD